MQVDEKGLEAACRAAWPEGFSDDPHVAHRACSPCDVKHWQDGSRDRVRAIITAYLSARSAEPVADAYYEAWKENFERKVRFAYAHPTPEPTP